MNKTYEKYIQNGKVAVLYSPGHGAGWYSWNTKHEGLLFDKDIVCAVLAKDYTLAAKIAEEKYPKCYTGGADQLQIKWLEAGDWFDIKVNDGYEKVIYSSNSFLEA